MPPSTTAALTALAAAGRDPTDITLPTAGSQAGGAGGADAVEGAGATQTATDMGGSSAGGVEPGAKVGRTIYRPNRSVMPHHLIVVRITLDATGLMDRADFDDFVASISMK